MKKSFGLGLTLAITLCLLGLFIWQNRAWLRLGADPLSEEKQQQAVANVVEEFGKRLKRVSLLDAADAVKESMEENYRGLVSPELIEAWSKEPLKAPGRLTSSPWPDRIEISSITKVSAQAFKVEGKIIEITSAEVNRGRAAARRPITLDIEKVGDRWLITAVTLGGYEDPDAVLYENTQYGFTFSLPATWNGYSIVSSTWNGTAVDGPRAGQVVETGPVISIRHPEWTAERPRQDIPIMVFTVSQWNRLQAGEFSVSAAPVGPRELGRNSKYVFALPARYNYAFPEGFEEVERILEGNPLRPAEEIH